MANTIQFKRGLEADRTSVTPAVGEILYTTDDKKVYIGDGTTAGGNIVSAAGGAAIEATASGALANGDLVVVNSDGTVSVVAGQAQAIGSPAVFESAASYEIAATYDSANGKVVIAYRDNGNSFYGTAVVGTVSGTSISFGTPVVFESALIYSNSATYDSANGKVVIAYTDNGNSNYGTAVVGTVSGTSISFGTPVVFESANTDSVKSATYDSANSKVVIAYTDYGNSGYGTAIVGTVSGTSISFGTAVVFESAEAGYISATYDSSNSKVVVAYRDTGNSSYGTAIVGTVSGTSISFGTPTVFESASSDYISATYDSANGKVVIAYRDVGNSSYGTAVVGTVSGTSISFGTPVVFQSAASYYCSATYDSANGKVVIAYRDGGNSNYGTLITGTVNGTSIGFGAPVVFESANTYYCSAIYDSANEKVVIAYRDAGNLDYGTAVVFQNEGTNLTASNFVGISDGAYADTATATIQTAGAIDDAQTGLTAGPTYYVQQDGTLSTAAGSPSVVAGTAVSSTSILVKG